MEEAARVLERLDRIDALRAAGVAPPVLLLEVRGLLSDAESWIRAEGAGTEGAELALARCRAALNEHREAEAAVA
ncbi:MAG TPA: hypothetical protein VES61_08225 [Gaiellaceae bacterium]|nr:hypothetical protein [Gaiellaceae bacterium]